MGGILSKKEVVEERIIDFLTDFDIEFVSLVDHGANRAPFKIVRSANSELVNAQNLVSKEGEGRMLDVIQSVLVPADVSRDDLKSRVGWLCDINLDEGEKFEFYSKHQCIPLDKFDQSSFRIERVDGGALALVGTLLEDDEKAIIYRGHLDNVAGFNSQGYAITLRDLIGSELTNTINAVISTLELSEMSVKEKKKAVGAALNSFRAYIEMGLDHAAEGLELRFERSEGDASGEIIQEDGKVMSEEVVERVEAQEAPEVTNFAEVFERVISEKLPEVIDRALAGKVVVSEPVTEERKEDVNVKVEASGVDELMAHIKSLEERFAKFEAEDAELPAPNADEQVVEHVAKPANIWSGVLFSRI